MEIDEALQADGRRVTQARRVVWEVLRSSETHLSAQQIADRVGEVAPTINRSSVYRALALFDELGLVRESRLAGENPAATWEITHGDGVIHLVCRSCGAVEHHHTDLIDRLRRSIGREVAFEPEAIDVRVTGHCLACGRPD
jgi:Fur family transcriptional regulator, ferric uptake regulator